MNNYSNLDEHNKIKFSKFNSNKNCIYNYDKNLELDNANNQLNQIEKDVFDKENYFKYKYLSNDKKAEIFTKNSKIFIRSLSDAVTATKQINNIQNLRNYDKLYTYILNNGIKNNEFLLVKYCSHELCDPNLIACRRKISYEIYLITKFALNIYIKNHAKLKSINDYDEYDQFLNDLLKYMKRDLNDYSKYIKKKYQNELDNISY
jgi:hypothetical protein